MSSVDNSNENITYCVSVLVQGVKCPAERRGKPCHMAHVMGKVNPRKCNRESESGGEECRCKYRKYPFVCQFIHEGETKEDYAKRVGFDPKHVKYDHYSLMKIKKELDDCGELLNELKKKIAKFNLDKVPAKDIAYVRRTQNSIHHLSLKIKWLNGIRKEKERKRNNPNDKYYLSPVEKKENREITRRLFGDGEYVVVDRTFECEEDVVEYERYYEEAKADFYSEYYESEYGRRGKGLDTCILDLRIMKDWIRMAISKWDEEEEYEAKKKETLTVETNIDYNEDGERQSQVRVVFETPKTTMIGRPRKASKRIETKMSNEKLVTTDKAVEKKPNAWGANIIYKEKQRELEKNVVAVSKAEHERLHRVNEDDWVDFSDFDLQKAAWEDRQERLREEELDRQEERRREEEEDFLAEKKWQAENRKIQAFEDEMGRLYVENGYSETHEDDNGDRYFRTPEEKAKNREKVRAKFKKGKYVRVEDVFEDENDEACYEEYLEMMEQDAMRDMDMEGSLVDMEMSIARDWVEGVIKRWDLEDKGEKFEDLHLKDAWGNYRDWDQKKATWEDRHDKWEEQLRERGDSE